jgi:hypothetical protein
MMEIHWANSSYTPNITKPEEHSVPEKNRQIALCIYIADVFSELKGSNDILKFCRGDDLELKNKSQYIVNVWYNCVINKEYWPVPVWGADHEHIEYPCIVLYTVSR